MQSRNDKVDSVQATHPLIIWINDNKDYLLNDELDSVQNF